MRCCSTSNPGAESRGQSVGRKIGFTNRTIWPRYGVFQPMWAHVWSHTVHFADAGQAILPLRGLVQPRIEPEIVFKLAGPLPLTDDPVVLLRAVDWMAPSFEIVQSHFPDWKFKAADCTAAFGLHGALVIGTPVPVTAANRTALASALPDCQGHTLAYQYSRRPRCRGQRAG
jgi:2-keto-4-pentenoate hydratase